MFDFILVKRTRFKNTWIINCFICSKNRHFECTHVQKIKKQYRCLDDLQENSDECLSDFEDLEEEIDIEEIDTEHDPRDNYIYSIRTYPFQIHTDKNLSKHIDRRNTCFSAWIEETFSCKQLLPEVKRCSETGCNYTSLEFKKCIRSITATVFYFIYIDFFIGAFLYRF